MKKLLLIGVTSILLGLVSCEKFAQELDEEIIVENNDNSDGQTDDWIEEDSTNFDVQIENWIEDDSTSIDVQIENWIEDDSISIDVQTWIEEDSVVWIGQ